MGLLQPGNLNKVLGERGRLHLLRGTWDLTLSSTQVLLSALNFFSVSLYFLKFDESFMFS